MVVYSRTYISEFLDLVKNKIGSKINKCVSAYWAEWRVQTIYGISNVRAEQIRRMRTSPVIASKALKEIGNTS
jgi:hypothetical protein